MAGVKCSNCRNTIVDCIVKCVQCVNEVVLCLQCFACSIEIGQHKKSHDYQILTVHPTEKEVISADKIFSCNEDDKWTIAEEELLLEAVEHHGFGSWQEVADFVKSKTAEFCEKHFRTYYIDGNIGQAVLVTKEPMKCIDHTKAPAHSESGVLLTVMEQQELGYMSLRDDFERTDIMQKLEVYLIYFRTQDSACNEYYNNDAESLVCDIALHYTDSPIDSAFQLCQVDMYRHELKERLWRKNVAKHYSVLRDCTSFGWRTYRTAWKKRTREEKEYQERFKKLGRFMAHADYLNLFRNMRRQEKLQKQLQTLIKFNSQGHKSFRGKLKMHAIQMNGLAKGAKKRRKKFRRFY